MSVVMQFNVILSDSSGFATYLSPGCPDQSFYLMSSLVSAPFAALNIFWGVIMYSGLDERLSTGKGSWKVIATVIGHYLCSMLTLVMEKSCSSALVPIYLLTIAFGVAAWRVTKMRFGH